MSGASGFDRRAADSLLRRLLALPAGDRRAALDAACDDSVLRDAVLRLLQAAEAPSRPFDPGSERSRRLWTGFTAEAVERETPMAVGTLVGPYRVLEEIERGGMAVVYRAERVDGELTREVAVKVLKLGLGTEDVVRRFELERQILADLDHPNIARLIDAGRTGDDQPYFVMELVAGVPIDRYCDEQRLTVDERLELFRVVAGAVEYAHQNLVVHRDLKPSNILVDRAGEVKLLDFGIARLLDAEAGGPGSAAPTRGLVRMMTPEYASPEQVRGERVTTASDVYQLGLLLYELLTGHRPYVVSGRITAELERTICERPATRPSVAVSRKEKSIEAVYDARRTSPARLSRRLRGDLDNIVLMALRKEPERRYRTADRLAQDIRRHLDGLPVSARADTWGYRGRKFLARHAVGAIAAAAALVLAAGMMVFYAVRIQSERDKAQAERDRAQAEAARADQMNRFLTGLFRAADPREAIGADLTARELLDRGVEQVDRDLSAQPATAADMLHVLGRTYLEMGAYDQAERLLTRALDLLRRRQGGGHPDVAGVLSDLGLLRYQLGEYARAREHLDAAVQTLESSRGSDAHELAGVLSILGQVQDALGERENGRASLERALAIESQASGEDSLATAMIYNGLAILLVKLGELDRADDLYERALATFQREHGPEHPRVGTVLMNLASLRSFRGSHEGLGPLYQRSLAIAENTYGPEHAKTGVALMNLGNFLNTTERSEEAIEVLERAYDVMRGALRPQHPNVAIVLTNLGEAHYAVGDVRQAQMYLQQSATVREAAMGETASGFDPLLAYSLVRLGRIEAELGDDEAAEHDMGRALRLLRQAPEDLDPQLAPALVDLGRWLAARQRCAEAMPLLQRVAQTERLRQSLPSSQATELESLLGGCIAS